MQNNDELIKTQRLTLRFPRAEDGPALYEAMLESREQLARLLNTSFEGRTPESVTERCRQQAAECLSGESFALHAFDAGHRLIGSLELHKNKDDTYMPVCFVRASEQGKGYATEAGVAVLQYLAGMGMEIKSSTTADNEASQGLHLKLGFRKAQGQGFHYMLEAKGTPDVSPSPALRTKSQPS
jgi:RimJ/RimL family protein N-acetyltransferase